MAPIWLRRLVRSGLTPSLGPDGSFHVIGDVHGRFDLLTALLPQLNPELPVVLVGDYVDRGDFSAQVLRFLAESGHVCLKGNHEDMMLSFLDRPDTSGPHWLRNGGLQTMASFGITRLRETAGASDLRRAREALARAMGADLIGWLRALPLWHRCGNVAVVHAGADPDLPLEDQDEQTLLWGHPRFSRRRRRDGVWIVHGHTIVPAARCDVGRIAVDTGAFSTGRLSAATITPEGVTFTTT